MKRIKAIFNAFRTLGRSPVNEIGDAWRRVAIGEGTSHDHNVLEQLILGAQDEAIAWMKKQGEEVEGAPAGQ